MFSGYGALAPRNTREFEFTQTSDFSETLDLGDCGTQAPSSKVEPLWFVPHQFSPMQNAVLWLAPDDLVTDQLENFRRLSIFSHRASGANPEYAGPTGIDLRAGRLLSFEA